MSYHKGDSVGAVSSRDEHRCDVLEHHDPQGVTRIVFVGNQWHVVNLDTIVLADITSCPCCRINLSAIQTETSREQEMAQKIIGRTIEEFSLTSIKLDDGTRLQWSMEGGPGLDSGWYQWLIVRLNGQIVYRG